MQRDHAPIRKDLAGRITLPHRIPVIIRRVAPATLAPRWRNTEQVDPGHRATMESLKLVVGMVQIDRRLTMTATTEATSLDASTVKKAPKILGAGSQICVHGRAHNATYERAE